MKYMTPQDDIFRSVWKMLEECRRILEAMEKLTKKEEKEEEERRV